VEYLDFSSPARLVIDGHTQTGPTRKIIYIDIDALYSELEQRDFPAASGKPGNKPGLSSGTQETH
jgi:hypothetical protein